jgi:hypothetical protein
VIKIKQVFHVLTELSTSQSPFLYDSPQAVCRQANSFQNL